MCGDERAAQLRGGVDAEDELSIGRALPVRPEMHDMIERPPPLQRGAQEARVVVRARRIDLVLVVRCTREPRGGSSTDHLQLARYTRPKRVHERVFGPAPGFEEEDRRVQSVSRSAAARLGSAPLGLKTDARTHAGIARRRLRVRRSVLDQLGRAGREVSISHEHPARSIDDSDFHPAQRSRCLVGRRGELAI